MSDSTLASNRLVLGTVQLGMNYGVANSLGKPGAAVANNILRAVSESGVQYLDTAQAYGDSEDTIAGFLRGHPRKFRIVSKLRPDVDPSNCGMVIASIRASADKLGRPLFGMMLHNPDHLSHWSGPLREAFQLMIGEGVVERAGVSVYTPEQFDMAVDNPDISLIQAPFNALDRRLRRSGTFDRAAACGKIVFIRSVYLQGLLLLRPAALPRYLAHTYMAVSAWQGLCASYQLDPRVVAMKYVQQTVPGALLVLGCETEDQWRDNVAIASMAALPASILAQIDALPIPAEDTINPSLWKRNAT